MLNEDQRATRVLLTHSTFLTMGEERRSIPFSHFDSGWVTDTCHHEVARKESKCTESDARHVYCFEGLALHHAIPPQTSVNGTIMCDTPSVQNNHSCCNVASSSFRTTWQLITIVPSRLCAGLELGNPCTTSILVRPCSLRFLFVFPCQGVTDWVHV